MATVGNLAVTLNDWRLRTAPDGTIDYIVETLAQSNPILQHMLWMEGNLPTGNQTTQRTSIPTPTLRRINRGADNVKSTTRQITDTCSMLEARSEIDIELLALQPDKEAFRRSEDSAIMEGFAQTMAKYTIYGDSDSNPDEFNGLAVRYNALTGSKGDAGYQVISAGTGGTNTNTSAWLVGWGERTVAGIYPKNSQAGLKMRDLGEQTVEDADGKKFQAVSTLFNWKAGLAVRDLRQIASVRNIDVSTLKGMTSTNKVAMIENFIYAKNRVRNLDAGKFQWYLSDSMYTFLETYLIDKNNVHVTRQELMGKPPQIYLSGIPVFKLDAISETEAKLV